jgi:hypothetical protein
MRKVCMLPWVGFLGRLVDFLVDEIRRRGPDSTPDHRKYTALALLRLHDSLRRHEILGRKFVREANPFMSRKRPRLYRAVFADIAYCAEISASGFQAGLRQLHLSLEHYDPKLALLLTGKAPPQGGSHTTAFLSPMRFGLAPTEESVFAIGYTAPAERLLYHNFEDTCEAVLADYRRYEVEPREIERTETMWMLRARKYSRTDYLLDLVQSNLIEGVVQADRIDQLRELLYRLETQLPAVPRSCDKLKRFLQENFQLVDLLHVSERGASPF